MTEEEKIICKHFLDDADKTHSCNEYKLLMALLEQEPTTKNDLGVDAISRSDVLKLMQDNWHTHNGDWAMQESMDDIRALPSVTPQEPRWIHVSERLPEDGKFVLFSDIDNDIMIGYHVKGRPNTHFTQDGTYEDMKNVRAWMPLPKPYKGRK